MTTRAALAAPSGGHRLVGRLERIRRAWRRNGAFGFLALCAYNLRLALGGAASRHDFVHDDSWDRLHGLDTAGVVEVDELGASAAAMRGAVRYEATPPECFHHLVERAAAGAHSSLTFIDIGSGKGRTVLMAAMAGFRKAIGVELGAELHTAAVSNLKRLRGRLGAAEVELLNADARDYRLEPEPTLLFLNNPFDAEILAQLLAKVEESLVAAPRPFTIIYYHCNHATLFAERPSWRPVAEGWWRDESHHYAIYRWATPSSPQLRGAWRR